MVNIPYKRQLAKLSLEKELLAVLDDKIKGLPNFNELRLNPEVVLLCCNIIENSIEKKDKVQKKDLAVKVLGTVFSHTPVEKKAIEDQIEFLWANKRIKKIKLLKKVWLFLKDYAQRKWL